MDIHLNLSRMVATWQHWSIIKWVEAYTKKIHQHGVKTTNITYRMRCSDSSQMPFGSEKRTTVLGGNGSVYILLVECNKIWQRLIIMRQIPFFGFIL
ncbi:hypothetical protein F8M41_004411 [Gigaspora margarita]|uniref:Uncharacterized protein n=1 Tax=Gigaspora margarita TaxID=4874 RepID=A0A8H4B4U7_GIGMA|nr:hypothetical protein F8M41_004411 [Gigaspora margarita]